MNKLTRRKNIQGKKGRSKKRKKKGGHEEKKRWKIKEKLFFT